ncbi:Protein IQ-DOMAIN like [Actinidia chinensis var. chinensis]|uniref:Protein IQ-DOMAIN like n=1 Tax=Actinidia chinensis var. chinensis TaxID=1590841 RepID=A0A2R6R3K3_ACTCC|nr:Protein IQ-DOMAIN like [Actinidia chinensis var. chinensis]
MGKSTASCFQIIACGSDSVHKGDVEASESKGSSDKRGWSFRKRSASHRVLSNTIILETPSPLNKESPGIATANVQVQCNATFPEKTSAMLWTDEKPELLTSVNSKVSDTRLATVEDKQHDVKRDESDIVALQASIRGFLAQREMLKLKSVVQLQSAVRGHLVRNHAAGTLRCVKAIIKMQALIRARRARLLSEGSCTKEKLDWNHEKGNSETKPNVVYTSIEKLLSNKFAHQLLESAPTTKRIHIKCDPSRSDSAWKWLERWMSVLPVGAEQPQKLELRTEQHEQVQVDCSVCQVENGYSSEGCESTALKANIMETIVLSKSEEDLITYDADNFDFQACQPSSPSKRENPQPSQPQNSVTSNSEEISLELLPNLTKHSDPIPHVELKSISSKPETESEQSTCSVKRFTPQQVETQGKKFLFGTRKATNPAFIAVQSKFEELSSTASLARSTGSHNKDAGIESNSNSDSSTIDNEIRTMEIGLVDYSVLHTSRVKVGRSESGTELSISSTLDSPDRSEIGAMDVEQEPELSEEGTSNPNSLKSLDIEANCEITIPGSDLSSYISVQPEKLEDVVNGESGNSVTAVDSLQENPKSEKNASSLQIEGGLHPFDCANGILVNSVAPVDLLRENQKSETNASNLQIDLDVETGNHNYKSSPEASPRSRMTVAESQATPSSQMSVKAERTGSDRGASKQKRKSLSAGKRPPSNPNHDSGARSSMEKLPKDHSTGKRRDSFGSGRADYADQEPRDNNSSNPLPNYMQATESARAKALANSSPRSSPDVQDKEIYIKKRHSLPGANGRQGSPHIQRSTSRTEQGAKGNCHPHERKWQR